MLSAPYRSTGAAHEFDSKIGECSIGYGASVYGLVRGCREP
jgi:hypothetical protein